MRRFHADDFLGWPEAVSDGPELPCGFCGQGLAFDFRVSDDAWEAAVEPQFARDVVCLPCLDRMGAERGIDIPSALIEVQFIGRETTAVMMAGFAFRRPQRRRTT